MTLLDEAQVKKYFGCDEPCRRRCLEGRMECGEECMPSRALRVLRAMQEPIREGERYLLIDCEVICEKVAEFDTLNHTKHLGALRLPDQFQKRCVVCDKTGHEMCKPAPTQECKKIDCCCRCRCRCHQSPSETVKYEVPCCLCISHKGSCKYCYCQGKSSKTVEEKIERLVTIYCKSRRHDEFEEIVRELVALVKAGK